MEPRWVCLGAGAVEEMQLLPENEFEAENEGEKHPNLPLFPLPIPHQCLPSTAPRQKPTNIRACER